MWRRQSRSQKSLQKKVSIFIFLSKLTVSSSYRSNSVGIIRGPRDMGWVRWSPAAWNGGFSSVQFAKINVVLSAKALQDHDTVISAIDTVVAGKEMSPGVAGMRKKMVRRWHWVVALSTLELLQPGMLVRQVKTGVCPSHVWHGLPLCHFWSS